MEYRFESTVDVIMGPMGSGKTTELLNRLDLYEIGKRKVVLIKPAIDTRSPRAVSTHSGRTVEALVLHRLLEAPEKVRSADVVGIDEGQFFPDLSAGCEALAAMGKKVIVAGLSGDWQRNGFPSMMELLPRCETIMMRSAVCMHCGAAAPFTAHVGEMAGSIKVGDIGEYIPLCRLCYDKAANSRSDS